MKDNLKMLSCNSSELRKQESVDTQDSPRTPINEGMLIGLEHYRQKPTEYVAPPEGEKWKAVLGAIFHADLRGSEMKVLVCLIDHANPTNGRCDPSVACIMHETGLPEITVKRAIKSLKWKGYLRRQRPPHGSAATHIIWSRLEADFLAWQGRKQSWPSVRKGYQNRHLEGVKSDPSGVSKMKMTLEKEKRTLKGNNNPKRVQPPSAAVRVQESDSTHENQKEGFQVEEGLQVKTEDSPPKTDPLENQSSK